ncbi:hypothetical protein QQ054_25450 [Oscillatoria amoena NRMC-F 0135]|nr:hypothetical protein [Oscillatoria amoena NRMC-F 0135]
MEVLGETQDDAAGEAFDKAAKLMGLPYPGGPLIDRYAQRGNPKAFSFPKTEMPGLDFSFSGIKTAFLYFLRDKKKSNPQFVEENLNDLCASIQRHLVTMLLDKLERAVNQTSIKEVGIAGGVSANTELQAQLKSRAVRLGWNTYIPAFDYCTDNAAMIAMAAHYKFGKNLFVTLEAAPMARYPIASKP